MLIHLSCMVATHSGNSGNFDLFLKLRETQESFDFLKKVQGSFKILKISGKFFARFRMRSN